MIQKLLNKVKRAYKKTGLRPCRQHYYHRGRSCAIGALCIARKPQMRDAKLDPQEFIKVAYKILPDKGPDWIVGFVMGFDNRSLLYRDVTLSLHDRQAGHAAGLEVAKAIFAR